MSQPKVSFNVILSYQDPCSGSILSLAMIKIKAYLLGNQSSQALQDHREERTSIFPAELKEIIAIFQRPQIVCNSRERLGLQHSTYVTGLKSLSITIYYLFGQLIDCLAYSSKLKLGELTFPQNVSKRLPNYTPFRNVAKENTQHIHRGKNFRSHTISVKLPIQLLII